MKTDPSAMLRLGSVGAHIILGLVVGTQVLFAGLSVASYKEPWMVALALMIYAPGAVLLSRPHPDPFPLRWTVLVLVIGVATNALVEWNLPDSGWPGYASWNFGAVTWLSFFLAFRGRIGAGWLGLALMAALSDAEIERTMERHADDYAQAGFTPARMAQAVRQTRKTGYADITDTLTMGVSGVGCTFAASSTTLAAISFGAITQRLPAARKKEMAQLLLAQLPR